MQGDADCTANVGRSLKLRLTLGARAALLIDDLHRTLAQERLDGTACPISARSPTTTSRR